MEKITINVTDLNCISDGYHTMQELYDHRCLIFACLINSNLDKSWKSLLHFDGSMYKDWFICGINTKNGVCSYHLPIKYFDLVKCKSVDNAPEWRGETPQMCLTNLVHEFCK